MRKDPTEFRKRFQRWKNGELVYDAGRAVNNWTMEDEAGFNEWKSQLAPNLLATDENIYNMRDAYKSGALQELYEDGYYHLPSRDPRNGKFLKKPAHPTFLEGLAVDLDMGYIPYQKDHKTYTEPGWGLTWKNRMPKYDDGKESNITEGLINAGIGFIPVVGTLNEARQFIQEPSWEQAGWTALSAAGEFFPLLKGFKAAKNTAKTTEAAMNIARAAHKANQVAYYNRKMKNMLLIGTRRGKATRDTMDHMFRSKEKLDDAKSAYNIARNKNIKWKTGQYLLKGADDLVLPIVSNMK